MRDMVEVMKLTQVAPEAHSGLSMKIVVWSQGDRNLFVLGYIETLYRFFSSPVIEKILDP